jgi:hypothetical protein
MAGSAAYRHAGSRPPPRQGQPSRPEPGDAAIGPAALKADYFSSVKIAIVFKL